MESDQPVHEGFLLFPSSGKILKKAWQKKYCTLFEKSSSGISRIEIYENNSKSGQAKIVTLEDVIKITPKTASILTIVTKQSIIEFATLSEEDLTVWFENLKKVSFSTDDPCKIQSIEQDNDLYCSTEEAGIFYVKLYPSDASQRCNLTSKNYILVITSAALHLRNEADNKLLYTWPFSYIRKYGIKGGKFTFEAGRKCATGEGAFFLEHPNHHEIYRCLATKMKNMKKLLNRENQPTPSTLLECSDAHQLHAVLNMEPGSRNPLPPSLLVQNSFSESSSSLDLQNLSSVMSSIENLNFPVQNTKDIPKKPPRKCLKSDSPLSSVKINPPVEFIDGKIISISSSSSKYDTVENRIDAWKTMGIQESYSNSSESEIHHRDSSPSQHSAAASPQQHYVSLQHFSSKSNNTNNLHRIITPIRSKENLTEFCLDADDEVEAPKIISEAPLIDDQSYNHLNFFGQNSVPVLNPDYKQISATTTLLSPSSSTKSSNLNLYEEVNVIEAARLADDGHLGYARVKKDLNSGKLTEDNVDGNDEEITRRVPHQFQNHQAYAVISKTKRV